MIQPVSPNPTRKLIIYLSIVGAVAFCLQFIWEYVQCGYFYTMVNTLDHTKLMMSATFGDMMMSLFLFVLLAYVNDDIEWIKRRFKRHDVVIMILYALFLSFYFEIHALHTGRWGYNADLMPLFPNTPIGLVPIIQLLLLLPLVFVISRRVIQYFKL